MERRPLAFLLLLVLAVSSGAPAAADSYGELKEIINKAIEKLEEFEKQIEVSSNSSEIIGKVIRKGYEFFSQSSTVGKVTNLDRRYFEPFTAMTLRRLRVPEEDAEEIHEKVFMRLHDDTEPGKWVVHKMMYNPTDDPESTKYISIFGYVNKKNNFNLVTIEVKARFTLAKNLLIIQNKDTGELSVETEEVETERLPEDGSVGPDDVKVLLNFFEAIGLRALKRKL